MVTPVLDKPFPNLFVAGAARSGTTAMCLYLKQHPDIHLSILKEPHYFATDIMQQPHAIMDKHDYLGLFTDKPVNVEGSVWYFISEDAPLNIKQARPDAKVILMLRRPWQQVQSLHALYVRTATEDEVDLQAAVSLMQQRKQGQCLPKSSYFHDGLQYLDTACYFDKVKRYQSVFGENLKVIIFDDFVSNTAQVMKDVFNFVNVEPTANIEFNQKQATLNLRNQVLKQLKSQPEQVRKKFHRNYVSSHETKVASSLSLEYQQTLMDYFKADVKALSDLIERDLVNLWYQES